MPKEDMWEEQGFKQHREFVKSVQKQQDVNTSAKDGVRQKITDICFNNGGVTKPMLDKLEKLIDEQVLAGRINQCERIDPYIDPEFRELFEKEESELQNKLNTNLTKKQ